LKCLLDGETSSPCKHFAARIFKESALSGQTFSVSNRSTTHAINQWPLYEDRSAEKRGSGSLRRLCRPSGGVRSHFMMSYEMTSS
jgi:hypothetical protein